MTAINSIIWLLLIVYTLSKWQHVRQLKMKILLLGGRIETLTRERLQYKNEVMKLTRTIEALEEELEEVKAGWTKAKPTTLRPRQRQPAAPLQELRYKENQPNVINF